MIPVLFILGVIASNKYQKLTGEKDSSVIVVDEVVGQLIAMMFVMDNLILVFISFIIFNSNSGFIILEGEYAPIPPVFLPESAIPTLL